MIKILGQELNDAEIAVLTNLHRNPRPQPKCIMAKATGRRMKYLQPLRRAISREESREASK